LAFPPQQGKAEIAGAALCPLARERPSGAPGDLWRFSLLLRLRPRTGSISGGALCSEWVQQGHFSRLAAG